jgi:hypothetical protein
VQAHLLDGVGNDGPGEGQVPERAGQAPVVRRVGDRGPAVLRELRLSVDRRVAVAHASPLQDVDCVLALVEEETLRPALGGDAEEVVKGLQVHHELPLKGDDRALLKVRGGCREHNVVDVEQEVDGVVVASVYEHRHVRLGLDEVDGGQVGGEATVPHMRRLFEAVQGAVQPVNQIRTSDIDKAGGLAVVDSLYRSVVEEGILDVELMDRLVAGDGEGADGSNGGKLNDVIEGLVIYSTSGC